MHQIIQQNTEHHSPMTDLSTSADGSPVSKPAFPSLQTLILPPHNPLIHHDFFFGPFLLQKGCMTVSGHDSPPPKSSTICSEFMFIVLVFYHRCSHALSAEPPAIRLVDYAASAAQQHKP